SDGVALPDVGRARLQVTAVRPGEEALDAVDDEQRAPRREYLEGVLRARHLGVHHRTTLDLTEGSAEAARLLDGHQRVVRPVDHEEGRNSGLDAAHGRGA